MSDHEELDENTAHLEEAVAFGKMAEDFLASSLGKHIKQMAMLEVSKARIALEDVDPEDSKAIRELQNIIARHKEFDQWIYDTIAYADRCYDEYQENESE